RVVRGSMRSWWSLPLMRSVIGMAPSIFDPTSVKAESLSAESPFARAGTYVATRLAATLLPVVRRNLRRVGSGGHDWGSSSDIEPPFEAKLSVEISRNLHPSCSRVEQFSLVENGPVYVYSPLDPARYCSSLTFSIHS